VKKLNDAFFGVDVALGVTDDLPRKPAPDMVHHAMSLLGADAASTVYIGDSEVDMQTAKNSGLPCISVLWGFRSRAELAPHNPECMIEHPSEILNLI
ncbi:MAG: HAD-IA family hydrolase, partial [Clostridia bacterium]|nr:HAD-IA family hydrolase [Clostridia bacterium]